MAELDSKQMPPRDTEPTAPPAYYMTEPPPYPEPQPPPQPTIHNITYVITQQPAPTPTITQVVAVPDHMGLAIFSCLCCFCPLGLAAIVMSCQSKTALERGDVSGAQSNSRTSRCLSLTAIGIGVLSIIISIIISVASTRATYYHYTCTGSGCDRR